MSPSSNTDTRTLARMRGRTCSNARLTCSAACTSSLWGDTTLRCGARAVAALVDARAALYERTARVETRDGRELRRALRTREVDEHLLQCRLTHAVVFDQQLLFVTLHRAEYLRHRTTQKLLTGALSGNVFICVERHHVHFEHFLHKNTIHVT